MPVLEKELLAPGEYHTPDGVVDATPRRLRHWCDSGNKMLRVRLAVPLPWEHQDDAKPRKAADRLAAGAKHNAGFVKRYYLDRDGHLWASLEVPDGKTAKHIEDNVRFVSPEIDESFTDGDGHEWRDVITHVALTPRPVFHRQKPFGARPRLSHGRTVRLSLEDLVQPGDSTMANDDYDDDTGADEGGQPDAQALIDELLPLLDEKFKLHLPDHVTPETLPRDLLMACHGHPGWSDDGLGQGDDEEGGESEEGEESMSEDADDGIGYADPSRRPREEQPGQLMGHRRRKLSRRGRADAAERGRRAAAEQLKNSGIKPRFTGNN